MSAYTLAYASIVKEIRMIFWITLVVGFLIGLVLGAILKNTTNKTQGELKCGRNIETGGTVYRIEFDIPLEEVPSRRRITLRVVHTADNLGINQRLYDLNSEGIHNGQD